MSLTRELLAASILLVGCMESDYEAPLELGQPDPLPPAATAVERTASRLPAAPSPDVTPAHPTMLILGDLAFQRVPEGHFIMGSPDGEPGRSHGEEQRFVAVYDPFYIMVTEVTRAQFARRMGGFANPQDFPATDLTWDDAVRFCERLHREFPRYHFHLPSEQEWEYACRAGSNDAFVVAPGHRHELLAALEKFDAGDTTFLERFLRNHICFDCGGPRAVRSLTPNAWGLHEMQGNVWEWCEGQNLSHPDLRAIRGGAWSSTTMLGCRAAARGEEYRDVRKPSIGFRVVAEPVR